MKTNLQKVIWIHEDISTTLEALEDLVAKRSHLESGNESYYLLFGKPGEKEADLAENLALIEMFMRDYNHYKEQLNKIQITITIPQKDEEN